MQERALDPRTWHAAADPDALPGRLALLFSGALLAFVAAAFQMPAYALRFVATLAHEIGHAAVATTFGAPSFPAIRLDGHAAAFHSEPFPVLQVALWAILGWFAWDGRVRTPRLARTLAVAAVAYPLFAFTGVWQLVTLFAGQGGELVFAGVFFYRAWTGGFTHGYPERVLYAALAWALAVGSVRFHLQLLGDREFQARYLDGGSFGLANDYVRIAHDWLDCSVGAVAFVMLLVTVLALPALVVWAVRKLG